MIRWFICRDGRFYWPSGWLEDAGFATSYDSEDEARTALTSLASVHAAAFSGATVESRTLQQNPETGRWQAEPPAIVAVPVQPELPAEPEKAVEVLAEHPADAAQGAGDPDEVAQQERKNQIAHQAQDAALKRLMDDPAGAAWMRGVLAQCHIAQTAYKPDSDYTVFAAGERNIGNYLLSEITRACGNAAAGAMLIGETDAV